MTGNLDGQIAYWKYRLGEDGFATTIAKDFEIPYRNTWGASVLNLPGVQAHDDWRWANSRFTESSIADFYQNIIRGRR